MNALTKSHIRKWILTVLIFTICASVSTACKDSSTNETAVTAALGPADAALPYQAVFAVDRDADEQIILAAQNFCSRIAEFSEGSAVFSMILSDNALGDLKSGKADVILIEHPDIDAFMPVTEAFRYRSYEHFAMTVNSASTLRILSDVLDADVFAGFYAGSNIFLSRGSLDSKFNLSPRKDSEDSKHLQSISVAALSGGTARAFSQLISDVTTTKELETRIHACSSPNTVVEFSHFELDTPALPEALRENNSENESSSESDDESDTEDDFTEPDYTEPEPYMITQAFTGIKPVWLIFENSGYEKLSQTNRAAAAEAAAYMVSDIDGFYIEYEHKMRELLAAEGIVSSHDFAATRAQTLRLADRQYEKLTGTERKLRDDVAMIQ